MTKIVQKIVLGGVVVKDGKVLILQRHKDEDIYPEMWELPSGKQEPLEASEQSLIREIKEETGLDVEVIMPFSVFNYQIEKPGEIKDSTQINFLVKTLNNIVILSKEHQNYAWIELSEIEKYNLSDKTKKVIKDGFSLVTKIG